MVLGLRVPSLRHAYTGMLSPRHRRASSQTCLCRLHTLMSLPISKLPLAACSMMKRMVTTQCYRDDSYREVAPFDDAGHMAATCRLRAQNRISASNAPKAPGEIAVWRRSFRRLHGLWQTATLHVMRERDAASARGYQRMFGTFGALDGCPLLYACHERITRKDRGRTGVACKIFADQGYSML